MVIAATATIHFPLPAAKDAEAKPLPIDTFTRI
jgi:hypothetical protein